MNRKSITTSHAVVACEVCGRTLLRGEHADVFLHGGSRRAVCELCTARAVHEGWIREGLDIGLSPRGTDRGPRSLLGRLRSRRQATDSRTILEPGAGEHLVGGWDTYAPDPAVATPAAHQDGVAAADPVAAEPPPADGAPIPPPEHRHPDSEYQTRGERHVAAVPTNAERKVIRALEVFNAGQHPRTVAGVARSLGAPFVSVRPSETEGSVVSIVVGWELSWYRYEVDLGDEASGVRVVAQGSVLSELDPVDHVPNAAADELGHLHPASALA